MKLPPPAEPSFWETIVFCFIAAVFLFVSFEAGMRMVGIAAIIGAVVISLNRRVTYGWKGHEPSGCISGIPAILFGLLQGTAGIFMLLQPELILAILAGTHK